MKPVSIERLVPGGDGVGKWPDGRIAFVPQVVPGDVVAPLRVDLKERFVRVEEYELKSSSSKRRPTQCKVAGSCGGCDWMAMEMEDQLEHKAQLLGEALRRTGGFEPESLPTLRVIPSPRSLGYRSRVRLQVQRGQLGYFSRRSRSLVPFESCAVASPQLSLAISLLKERFGEKPEAGEAIESIEVRALDSFSDRVGPESCALHFGLKKGIQRRQVAALVESLKADFLVRVGKERTTLQMLPSPIDNGPAAFSAPGAFTQVNPEVNSLLVGRVVQAARQCGAKTFLDVYCGTGNFSLPLLHAGLRGTGIEQGREAVTAARRGAERARLPGKFLSGAAEKLMRHPRLREASFDLAVVDPPRCGAKAALEALVAMSIPTAIMISCDPVTLARDLRFLVEEGYQLGELELFDMFPQTHHFETLSVLHKHGCRAGELNR